MMQLVALALAVTAACANDRVDEAGLLEQRQADFFAAVEARDADRVAELFSERGVVHVANMPPIEGRSAIREFYGNMFGFLTASEATPEATYLSEGGRMAYGVGSTENEFRGPDGPVAYLGKYLLVWEKVDDEWRVAAYSISGNESEAGR
jgi:ketosteroid isomerase-like protein